MNKLSCLSLASLVASIVFCQPVQAAVQYVEQSPAGVITQLPVSSWSDPDVQCKGVVVFVHGITQRAWSANSVATRLAASGYTVYGVDQRGHGHWRYSGKKGNPGYESDFNQTARDVEKILPVVQQTHSDLPITLIGESAGAGVALRVAAACPSTVCNVVLAGTGSKPAPVKLSWALRDVLTNFFRLGHQIDMTRYQRKYGTDDAIALEESFADCWQRPSMSGKELLRVSRFMRANKTFARKISPRTAVLVIQGSEDKVLRPESARKVYTALPTSNKQYLDVANCGHIILGTTRVKPLISNSILSWLAKDELQTTIASGLSSVSANQVSN